MQAVACSCEFRQVYIGSAYKQRGLAVAVSDVCAVEP